MAGLHINDIQVIDDQSENSKLRKCQRYPYFVHKNKKNCLQITRKQEMCHINVSVCVCERMTEIGSHVKHYTQRTK